MTHTKKSGKERCMSCTARMTAGCAEPYIVNSILIRLRCSWGSIFVLSSLTLSVWERVSSSVDRGVGVMKSFKIGPVNCSRNN